MTREDFDKSIEENTEELFFDVSAECTRLIRSGAICLEDAPTNARIPKIVLCAALQNIAMQYLPPDAKGRKEVKNLLKF